MHWDWVTDLCLQIRKQMGRKLLKTVQTITTFRNPLADPMGTRRGPQFENRCPTPLWKGRSPETSGRLGWGTSTLNTTLAPVVIYKTRLLCLWHHFDIVYDTAAAAAADTD